MQLKYFHISSFYPHFKKRIKNSKRNILLKKYVQGNHPTLYTSSYIKKVGIYELKNDKWAVFF